MTKRRLILAFIAGLGALPALTIAGLSQPATPQRPPPDPQLQAAIVKSNAYIGLMNRTLRASESWNRYTSWVNVKTGPTGRERYITYGLYSLYDVRSEIEKANAATLAEPKAPELDAAVLRYIAAYQTLAPLITKANGYYERQDYKSDAMAEGKTLHAAMVPAAEAFLAERAKLDREMKAFKQDLDTREIAAIEAREGRNARYHVRAVMMGAGELMDLIPTTARPVVDMKAYDAALTRFATLVRAFDEWKDANPGKLSSFESMPDRFLGKLREFQTKLARAKGDARRGAGQDITWIVNDYNMMISMSQSALTFMR